MSVGSWMGDGTVQRTLISTFGNFRFSAGNKFKNRFADDISITKIKQFPVAVIDQ